MYNLAQHYENIFQHLKTIIADPRLIYLHPFGSTRPENIETLKLDTQVGRTGPTFIFYDQEPLHFDYNQPLFDHILNKTRRPYVLVNTERDSAEKDKICEHYRFAHLDYFFHIFAAADWYRGHQYNPLIVAPENRQLEKTYISFNRLTSGERIYRTLLVNELLLNNLLEHGYVSYSKVCPDGGDFADNLRKGIENFNLDDRFVEMAIQNINLLPELRIDFPEQTIPNQSMLLSPMDQLMKSFIFLVTETCFWQTKTHLTEKIFKPIVLRMPFILAGCANNLAYLRSYGFKTFSDFWDESYDSETDPVKRIEAIAKILKTISSLSQDQQKQMLMDMRPVLNHNYNLFNDPNFVQSEWDSLTTKLTDMCGLYQFRQPYQLEPKLGQAIPL
jgi:hypothetical protein